MNIKKNKGQAANKIINNNKIEVCLCCGSCRLLKLIKKARLNKKTVQNIDRHVFNGQRFCIGYTLTVFILSAYFLTANQSISLGFLLDNQEVYWSWLLAFSASMALSFFVPTLFGAFKKARMIKYRGDKHACYPAID